MNEVVTIRANAPILCKSTASSLSVGDACGFGVLWSHKAQANEMPPEKSLTGDD